MLLTFSGILFCSGSMANQFCGNLQGVGRFMKGKNCHPPYLHRLSKKPIWVTCVVSCCCWVDYNLSLGQKGTESLSCIWWSFIWHSSLNIALGGTRLDTMPWLVTCLHLFLQNKCKCCVSTQSCPSEVQLLWGCPVGASEVILLSFVVDPVQLDSQPWLVASLWRFVLNKASAMFSRKAAFL